MRLQSLGSGLGLGSPRPRASVVDNFAACLLVERLIATLQIKIVNDLELSSDEMRVMTRPTQEKFDAYIYQHITFYSLLKLYSTKFHQLTTMCATSKI